MVARVLAGIGMSVAEIKDEVAQMNDQARKPKKVTNEANPLAQSRQLITARHIKNWQRRTILSILPLCEKRMKLLGKDNAAKGLQTVWHDLLQPTVVQKYISGL